MRKTTNLHGTGDYLSEAKKLGGFKTKRETLEAALKHFIDYQKRLKVLDALGTIDFVPTYNTKAERRKRTAKLESLGVIPPLPKAHRKNPTTAR